MKCLRCVKERRELDNTEDDDTRKALNDKWKATEETDKIIWAECKLRDFLELQSEDRHGSVPEGILEITLRPQRGWS